MVQEWEALKESVLRISRSVFSLATTEPVSSYVPFLHFEDPKLFTVSHALFYRHNNDPLR